MKELPPLAVSIADAVRMSGIGRTSLYMAIQRGALVVRKSGRRTVVPVESLQAFLANLPPASAKHAA
jgi:hypothetical protein